jgi:tetratricopeptide (TPR) repeat protein
VRAVVVAAALIGLACAPYWTETPPETARPDASAPLADRLAELADAIDPGPQPLLRADLPDWIERMVATPPKGDAIRRWDALDASASDRERIEALLELCRATSLAEKQLAAKKVDIATLLVLERAYHIFDRPPLAADERTFVRWLGEFAKVAAASGALDDQRMIAELARTVGTATQAAGALHRQTVARILRMAPEHRAVPDVLARTARGLGQSDPELAVDAMRLAIETRPPASVEPEHQLELAVLCFTALELQCGNEARQAAAPARHEGRSLPLFARVDELAKLASEAVRLGDRADVDARLRRAEIMLALRRFDDAGDLYRTLHRQQPKDARAVAGLARHAIASEGDLHAAYQLIERSEATEHRDRTYYEIAIATRATALLQDVLPRAAEGGPTAAIDAATPYLAKLRADVLAYEQLGAEDGIVLHFLLDRLDEAIDLLRHGKTDALRLRARSLLPSVRELQERVPSNIHAYRLLMAAATFSSDRKAAFEVVDAPLPELGPHARDAALRRARARLDLALAWEELDRLDDVLASELDPASKAHALGVKARLGGDRSAAIEAYRTAAADPAAPAVVLHDLAVLLHEHGDAKAAQQAWDRAAQRVSDDRRDIVRMHEFIASAEPRFLDIERYTRSADRELALLALRWAAHLAPPAQVPAIRKSLRRAEAEVRRVTLRPTLPPGRAGVLLATHLDFDLAYVGDGGLEFVFDVTLAPWLVLSPPR